MQMVQPEIKRIQAKYKNDRAKLNEEMMAFYQENKINPLAGCLPLLVQMPIFFALFQVLRNSYKYVPTSSKLYDFLCTPSGGDNPVGVEQCGKLKGLPNPTYFLSMNLSLSAPDQIEHAGQDPRVRPGDRSDVHRLHAVPTGPEAHPGHQQADGAGHQGPARCSSGSSR